jgi:diaminopimelate epimerase
MAKIFKLTGTGNNFLLVDLRHEDARHSFAKHSDQKSRSTLAKELCDPFQSVGADGLLFLENSSKADLKWDFYNADGSTAEMCGNAARCVYKYVESTVETTSKMGPEVLSVETLAGTVKIRPIYGEKKSDHTKYEVEMPEIKSVRLSQAIKHDDKKLSFDFVNTGVPHAVVQLNKNYTLNQVIEKVDYYHKLVSDIRSLSQFKKSGTNVTFYIPKSSTRIQTLTFERGVPSFTQACGTGVVAATYCHRLQFVKDASRSADTTISATVPGGELSVRWQNSKPFLIGAAKLVAAIEIL